MGYESKVANPIVVTPPQEQEVSVSDATPSDNRDGARETTPAEVVTPKKKVITVTLTAKDVKCLINQALINVLPSVGIKIKKVDVLPATGENGTLYLVPIVGGETPNLYDEYYWVDEDSGFELIGTTEIDLSGYATIDQAFNVINATDIPNNELTQAQVNIIYNGKRTRIAGTILSMNNPVLETCVYLSGSNSYFGIIKGANSTDVYSRVQYYEIYPITDGFKLQIYTNPRIELRNIANINGKDIPNYPNSPTVPQALIYDTDNTLKYTSAGFPEIPAPESTTLTDEQIAIISGGCIINGTFLNEPNPIFMPASNPQFNEITGIMMSGEGVSCNIYIYTINTNTKVITKYSGSSAQRLSISGVLRLNGKNVEGSCYYKGLDSSNIGSIASTLVNTGWYKNVIAITGGLTDAVDVKVKMSNGYTYTPTGFSASEIVIFSGVDFSTAGITVDSIKFKDN